MVRRFNENLMSPDTVRYIVDTYPTLLQLAFDLEGGELIGNNPGVPPRGVRYRSKRTNGINLRRSISLSPRTKLTNGFLTIAVALFFVNLRA
jgi:hypothetical protein